MGKMNDLWLEENYGGGNAWLVPDGSPQPVYQED